MPRDIAHDSPEMRKAVDWLISIQNADGGWGEDGTSYKLDYRGHEPAPSTASQTAWALLGLMAAGETDHPAVERGIAYLLRTQAGDGLWDEQRFTATGFPRVFYLRYHGYPKFFPALGAGAISQPESRQRARRRVRHVTTLVRHEIRPGLSTGAAFEARIAAGDGVLVVCAGGDPIPARTLLDDLDPASFRAVISFGLAGGLDPALRPGQLLIADRDRVWSRHLAGTASFGRRVAFGADRGRR